MGAGRSYEQAFRFGHNGIQLKGIPQDQRPVFLEGRPRQIQVFMSYREQDPDRALALEFSRILRDRGHQPFLAEEDIRLGQDWPERIDRASSEADYFLGTSNNCLILNKHLLAIPYVSRSAKLL